MDVPNHEDLLRDLVYAFTQVGEAMTAVAEQLRGANKIRVQALFAGQLDRAIDDPVLAAGLSTLSDLSEDKRRQMLLANKHYGLLLLSYEVGVTNRNELLGHLKVLSKSAVFTEYWARTSEHRALLPSESLEARIGRAVDAIMDERPDDLEEWWVVGPGSATAPD
ncbi:hypothetical protein EJ357_27330 [Streptomyces cyaneochromogenes]|uniref:Uncharacterized protein n=1 Tax=Streptomyces cyaneochromogenes TaxID=2496836 RepID=A0A3Q9EV34_9ACTN|nr:DUF6082 family protein [Streptomyces cyaneochromogenes]AZQ36698.1 hypothetical protein EJ357_27330 [Streptomyces cyaneochromogenes]